MPDPTTLRRRGFLKTLVGAVAAVAAPPVIQAAAPAVVEVAAAPLPVITSWPSLIYKLTSMMIREIHFEEDLLFINMLRKMEGVTPITEEEERKIRAAFQEETDRLNSLPVADLSA